MDEENKHAPSGADLVMPVRPTTMRIGGAVPVPMPPPFYHRRPATPVIDVNTEEADDVELIFTHYTYQCDSIEDANGGATAVMSLLDDGWIIEDKIIIPPFVTVLFSREKDEDDD